MAPACAQGEHHGPDPGSYAPAHQPTATSDAAAITGNCVVAQGTSDGTEIYQAGQSFYWAPGQAPEALEDCE